MATRPVFTVEEAVPYYGTVYVNFDWNAGLSKPQKQKNIRAIHAAFSSRMPEKRVLEISSKSMQEGGEALSAFHLSKYVPELERSVPVECVYQAGKVFAFDGPFPDLLSAAPRDAKRDERLRSSGRLVGFRFDGKDFPLKPTSAFYDYIYINALLENSELTRTVVQYDAFTDIEFNPEKSLNCQARAAAIFTALFRKGLLERAKSPESFLALLSEKRETPPLKNGVPAPAKAKPEKRSPPVAAGASIVHPAYGAGKVVEVSDSRIKAVFESGGEKILGIDWCLLHCKIVTP